MRIVLISCVAKKRCIPAKVKDMYISPLFKGAYRYAQKIGADRIFVLSAKYGLLDMNEIIEPYNETLNNKSVEEVKIWSKAVFEALSEKTDLDADEFVILAGERYRRYLIDKIPHVSIPLKGMSIGKQLAFYKENM